MMVMPVFSADVDCPPDITGAQDGNVTVGDADCLISGSVDGDVFMTGTGNLTVTGSINGNINMTGSGNLTMTCAQLDGNIENTGTGTVDVNNGTANIVNGNVKSDTAACKVEAAVAHNGNLEGTCVIG